MSLVTEKYEGNWRKSNFTNIRGLVKLLASFKAWTPQ